MRILFRNVWLGAWLAVMVATQAETTTEIYQIQSGNYTVVGGFAGVVNQPLPNTRQYYVELQYDFEAGLADMRILGDDYKTVFQRFSNGNLAGGQIVFSYPTQHPYYPLVTEPAVLDYTVQIGNASIWVNGSIAALRPICCDIPHQFEHSDVNATILSGPPPDPIGVYDYQGFDLLEQLVVEGILFITNRSDPLAGTWRLEAVGDPGNIGPQLGTGELRGSLHDGRMVLNLNPGIADDNVFLNGEFEKGTYGGEWDYTTFLGVVASGTFSAVKREIRMQSVHVEPQGVVCAYTLAPGMLCTLEYTDSLGAKDWREIHRFISTGEPEEWLDTTLGNRGRFYRLRVLDAHGPFSMVDCARLRLADHLGIPAGDLELLGAAAVDFPDTCCGCFISNQLCADVITPGYTISFSWGGEILQINTCGQRFVYCPVGEEGVVLDLCEL